MGNIGLYYVCYRLSLLGWNVMPTARNAQGIDLLAYNQDASKKYSVQVKALSRRSPVPLGKHLNHVYADFWVICRRIIEPSPECYILRPDEVRRLAHRGEREGRVSYWLQPREYEKDEFKDAWGRIGLGPAP